ncbi:MAG: hypothetical protein JXA41_03255 [Deltaproteobacteria bacterium]|nr:hypothetical protein [Deltaproteobacteria bacterium]
MGENFSENAALFEEVRHKPTCVVDTIIEKKLEEIAMVLCPNNSGKSKLYEEIITMVERSLFKTALKKTNYVKSAAAAFLGINRNTFQSKMIKLGIDCRKEQGK